jgi:hypothetical protein
LRLEDLKRPRAEFYAEQAGMHWTVGDADAVIALRCQQAGRTWEHASRDIPRPEAHTA